MVTREWGIIAYAPPECVEAGLIRLPHSEAHHLFHVLRVRAGDQVTVCDGVGQAHRCSVGGDKSLHITESKLEWGELPFVLTLVCGVLKGDGNREVVDAATQLGVREIFFQHFARCEGRLNEEKLERLRRVAITAMKQCGRSRVPQLRCIDSVEQGLALLPGHSRIWVTHPSMESRKVLPPISSEVTHETIVVGPEGGMTESELSAWTDSRGNRLDLGTRRLRTLIAVTSGLSHVLALRGEIRH